MRILVTNDDGIDGPGLHALVGAMCDLDGDHELIVVAPDREFSGASASLGALHLIEPVVTRASIPGADPDEVWTVSGPPGLCVMFARLGSFGDPFDLVVSGINPGANVGRAVYHSGTVGACLTGRNSNWSGVAVSQAVAGYGIEGQAWDEVVQTLDWSVPATIAQAYVQALVDDLPSECIITNLNVPHRPLDEIRGWKHTAVGLQPPRALASANLVQNDDDPDTFRVEMGWGEKLDLDPDTAAGAIDEGWVSVSHLSRIVHDDRPDLAHADKALSALLG